VPTVTGFTDTFLMATGFLVVCSISALLVPGRRRAVGLVDAEAIGT
jgi:hypothetical protein